MSRLTLNNYSPVCKIIVHENINFLKELSICHKLWFSQTYIFATKSHTPFSYYEFCWIKWYKFTPSGCIDIENWKFEFIAKKQYLLIFKHDGTIQRQNLKNFSRGLNMVGFIASDTGHIYALGMPLYHWFFLDWIDLGLLYLKILPKFFNPASTLDSVHNYST